MRRSNQSLSDAEIRARLQFTPRWFELGVIDEPTLDKIVREFRTADDESDEHYRWGAFLRFMDCNPALTPSQCRALFQLGADDPDWCMGAGIMMAILVRCECPEDLDALAAGHPRTAKHAAEMKRRRSFDPEKHRQGLIALGPEGYYLAHGYRKDGRRRVDQTVYKEMHDLFGIDIRRFRLIRDAAPGPQAKDGGED